MTTTHKARNTLKLLKENKINFDIMMIDVEMVDMDDSIELFQLVDFEMNLLVISKPLLHTL